MHQHLDKGLLVFFFFQLLEHIFLRLCHRTADAMAFALEFADADAGGGEFGHGVLAGPSWPLAGLFRQDQFALPRDPQAVDLAIQHQMRQRAAFGQRQGVMNRRGGCFWRKGRGGRGISHGAMDQLKGRQKVGRRMRQDY